MKVYISCPIRGLQVTPETYGTPEATKIVQENCQKATVFVNKLRERFPDIEFHNPAAWDLEVFISVAFQLKYLTEKQILAVDCEIIETSDLVIFFNYEGTFSRGMQIERDYAVDHDKRYIIWKDANNGLFDEIEFIKGLLDGK